MPTETYFLAVLCRHAWRTTDSILLTVKIFEACADFLTPDGLGSCRKRRNFGAHHSLVQSCGCGLAALGCYNPLRTLKKGGSVRPWRLSERSGWRVLSRWVGANTPTPEGREGGTEVFLDRFVLLGFRPSWHEEAVATLLERFKKGDGKGTAFADLVWKPVVLIRLARRLGRGLRTPSSIKKTLCRIFGCNPRKLKNVE